MQVHYRQNRNEKALRVNMPALAYMDDTIWIARSKPELQDILAIATSFYSLTNIQVNLNKSVLATLNTNILPQQPRQPPSIEIRGKQLVTIKKREKFRFLECWYSLTKDQTPT